jgi:hypothetical protein
VPAGKDAEKGWVRAKGQAAGTLCVGSARGGFPLNNLEDAVRWVSAKVGERRAELATNHLFNPSAGNAKTHARARLHLEEVVFSAHANPRRVLLHINFFFKSK